jgi:hypothetical protein
MNQAQILIPAPARMMHPCTSWLDWQAPIVMQET